MTLRLVVEHSPVPQPRAELRHDTGELTIGRGADCDWRIEDPEQLVSRRHCVISGGGDRWTVTDMSSGGLFVDGAGRPLGPGNSAPVENGTRLRLGDVLLRAEVGEARDAASASPARTPEADDFFARRDPAPPPPPRPESLPPRFDGESRPFEAPSRPARAEAPPLFDDPFTLGTADLRPSDLRPSDRHPSDRRPSEAGVREPDAPGRTGGGARGGADSDFGFGVTFGPSGDAAREPPGAGGRAGSGARAEDDWGFGLGTTSSPGHSGSGPGAVGSGADAPVGTASDPFGDWDLGGLSRIGAGGPGDGATGHDSGTGAATARGAVADDPFRLGTSDRVRVRNPDAADPRHAAEDMRGTQGSAAGSDGDAPQRATAAGHPTADDAGGAPVVAAPPRPSEIATPALPEAAVAGAPRGGTGGTANPPVAKGPGPAVGGQYALPQPDPGDAALVAAFLRGAGLEGAHPVAADEMEALGRRFRAMAEGLILLLRTRAQEKNSVRVAQTVFGARDVNPLKFAATPEEGVAALVAHRGKGYLDPDAAIEAALRDLTDHQLRTWTGLQTALRRMIDRFDPGLFEAEVEDVGMLKSLISGGRAARLWQLYTERYRDIATAAEGRFLGEVGADFRDAYEGSKGDGS